MPPIRAARGEIIIRMDAHSEYAPDYIRRCLEVLDETSADNVGGPALTRADGYLGAGDRPRLPLRVLLWRRKVSRR